MCKAEISTVCSIVVYLPQALVVAETTLTHSQEQMAKETEQCDAVKRACAEVSSVGTYVRTYCPCLSSGCPFMQGEHDGIHICTYVCTYMIYV